MQHSDDLFAFDWNNGTDEDVVTAVDDFLSTTEECNDSVQAGGFASNPYIMPWYLQVRVHTVTYVQMRSFIGDYCLSWTVF